MKEYHYLGMTFGVFLILAGLAMPEKIENNYTQSKSVITDIKINAPIIDEEEMLCLAKNIFFEARGETTEGKLAVAHVTVNRVHNKQFPNTVCDVVYQAHTKPSWLTGKPVPKRNKCQFSWYCDGKSDDIEFYDAKGNFLPIVHNSWWNSIKIAKDVLQGKSKDITKGSIYYYNPDKADPYWAEQ